MHTLSLAARTVCDLTAPPSHTLLGSLKGSLTCLPLFLQMLIGSHCILYYYSRMQQYWLTIEAIASIYGILLPNQHELPPGYPTVRSWLANRVRTLEGSNKEHWERTRSDPRKLQHARETNLQRVRAYRARKMRLQVENSSDSTDKSRPGPRY
jgi:hypothetical protein